MKKKEHTRGKIKVKEVRRTCKKMRRMCDTTIRDLRRLKIKL